MTRYPRRERGPEHHADDWLMTYADMITLLLCFFALFLSLSVTSVKKAAEKEPPKTAIEETSLPPKESPALQALPPAILSGPEQQEEASPQPEIAYQGEDRGQAAFEQKGDLLTTVEMDSAAFFDKGSATLSEAGKEVLRGVAANIRTDRYKDYQVTVEGHTDDTPVNTVPFPSNWELSTARASAVVHFFIEQGIAAQRLRAAGYADTFPKAPNRDEAGNPLPANQAQNRRVLIKLEKVDRLATP